MTKSQFDTCPYVSYVQPKLEKEEPLFLVLEQRLDRCKIKLLGNLAKAWDMLDQDLSLISARAIYTGELFYILSCDSWAYSKCKFCFNKDTFELEPSLWIGRPNHDVESLEQDVIDQIIVDLYRDAAGEAWKRYFEKGALPKFGFTYLAIAETVEDNRILFNATTAYRKDLSTDKNLSLLNERTEQIKQGRDEYYKALRASISKPEAIND